jgi:hypothetical protein
MPERVSIAGPATVYAVAGVYQRGDTIRLCANQFVVSGVCPLTKDEAVARFEAAVRADWPAGERYEDWTLLRPSNGPVVGTVAVNAG